MILICGKYGPGCGEIMNMMLQDYSTLYEIIGGKIKSIKSGFFAWKWVMNTGIKVLKSIEKDMRARKDKMTQYDNEVSIRILGIHMSPLLIWDRQF